MNYAAVGAFVDGHPDDVDPVVGPIIAAAGHLPAWQLFAEGLGTVPVFARLDAPDLNAVARPLQNALRSPVRGGPP